MRLRLRLLLRNSQKLKLKTSQMMLVGTFFLALIAGIVVFIFQFSHSEKTLASNNDSDSFRSYQGLSFQKIVHSTDGSFLVSDGTNFVKMDSVGKVMWSKVVSSPYAMIITGLVQTNDGDYVAVCQSNDTSNYKIGITRINDRGALKWLKVFSAQGSDFAYGVTADNDNGVVLTGGGCNISHFIMKVDMNGNASWMKDFAIAGTTGSSFKVFMESNGDILMAGRITSHGNYFISIVKTDQFGNFLWGKQIADQQLPIVKSFIRTNDGAYVIAGNYISQTSAVANNPFVIKLDLNGNVLWFKRIGSGNYESINDLAPAPDGGVIAVGNIFVNPTENVNALLLRLDQSGNIVWQKTAGNYDFNGEGYDDAYSICQNADGNYEVVGMAYWTFISKMDLNGNGFCHVTPVTLTSQSVNCQSSGAVYSQVPGQIFQSEAIITTSQNIFASAPNSCSASNSTTSAETVSAEKEMNVSLFPNPNDGNFNLNYQLPVDAKSGNLQVFDLTGKQIVDLELPSFTHSVSMHLPELTSGIYLYKIMSGNKELKKDKFVVTK